MNKKRVFTKRADVVNPGLKAVDFLIGERQVALSFPSGLPGTVFGHSSFEWVEGGDFLIMCVGNKVMSAPRSSCVVGRDDSAKTYTSLYFDYLDVSRIYQMSWMGKFWKQWRHAPGFAQRFIGNRSDDGKSINAKWEKSMDGKKWEHDFRLTYRHMRK